MIVSSSEHSNESPNIVSAPICVEVENIVSSAALRVILSVLFINSTDISTSPSKVNVSKFGSRNTLYFLGITSSGRMIRSDCVIM